MMHGPDPMISTPGRYPDYAQTKRIFILQVLNAPNSMGSRSTTGASWNIQAGWEVGDIVNEALKCASWQNADAAIRLLDMQNIPYLMRLGNP